MENSISEKINNMTDVELVKAITIDKSDYEKDFTEAANIELNKRNISLQDFIDNVTFEFNTKDKTTLKIGEAIEKMTDITIWQTLHFTNCFGDSLVFRKESFCWSLFYVKDENVETPFFIESVDEAKEVLSAFLNFADWRGIVEDNSEIDDWVELKPDISVSEIFFLLNYLEKNEIPASGILRGQIILPEELFKKAELLITERINFLYDKAEELFDTKEFEKEKEILFELSQFMPDDADVLLNLAITYYELQNYESAADIFIEIAQKRDVGQDLIEEVKKYLFKLDDIFPNNFIILNSLAQFFTFVEKDPNKAIEFYNSILTTKPEEEKLNLKKEIDSACHLNLGNLYYELEKDSEAVVHFNKYLELNPEAIDKEEIEEIINQIKK